MSLTFWMVPLRLRIINSTLWATSCVCLCRSSSTPGSMGGMSAGRRREPRLRLRLELILILCSKFLVMKCVSSRALEMVALRPSGCPSRPRVPAPPHAWLISSRLLLSCMPRTMRSRSGGFRTRTCAITWGGQGPVGLAQPRVSEAAGLRDSWRKQTA
uniref:Uncharacterized protein n=1 Tax=Paramormyrops kingsleyae TaxID=1676925 RepID=A0A3B3QSU7_9TELE